MKRTDTWGAVKPLLEKGASYLAQRDELASVLRPPRHKVRIPLSHS